MIINKNVNSQGHLVDIIIPNDAQHRPFFGVTNVFMRFFISKTHTRSHATKQLFTQIVFSKRMDMSKLFCVCVRERESGFFVDRGRVHQPTTKQSERNANNPQGFGFHCRQLFFIQAKQRSHGEGGRIVVGAAVQLWFLCCYYYSWPTPDVLENENT